MKEEKEGGDVHLFAQGVHNQLAIEFGLVSLGFKRNKIANVAPLGKHF